MEKLKELIDAALLEAKGKSIEQPDNGPLIGIITRLQVCSDNVANAIAAQPKPAPAPATDS